MKVAIDVSPLKSAHQFRGIGFYTKNLIDAFLANRGAGFQVMLVEKGNIPDDCDLVHYPYFDLFWQTLPLLKKKKTVVTVHDVIPLIFPKQYPPGIKGKLRFQFQRISLRTARAVICDSQCSKKDIVKHLNYPNSKIKVVYLAPSSKFRKLEAGSWKSKIKQNYRLPDSFVLYVGDVNYHKNVLGLVKACKLIKTPVVIVGRQAAQEKFDQNNIENQPLVQLIKLYGKDPGVIRLGFVNDENLVKLYNLASVYCQPSFYEGFGLPVLEAMTCGTPVVSSATSSLKEITGGAALMIDPYQTDQMARAIERILSGVELARELIKKGNEQVKKFSWDKVARETFKVYLKVYEEEKIN